MTPQKMKAISADLLKSIGQVLAAHGVTLAKATAKGSEDGSIVIKIVDASGAAPALPGLTANAVARYDKNRVALGLPARGTAVKIGGVLHVLVGLSTDGKRVKSHRAGANGAIDMPVAEVLHAVSMAAAAQVAALDAEDAAQPVDQIDPSITMLLGGIASKPKQK